MWASQSIAFTQALRACSAPQSGSLFPLNYAAHNQNTCLERCRALRDREEVVGYPSFYEAGLPCGRCAAVAAGGALELLNQLFCRTEKLQPNFLHSVFLPSLLFFLCLPTFSASFLSMLSQTGLAADRLWTRSLGSLHFLASLWERGGHESKYSTVISMQPSVCSFSFLCKAAVKFMEKLHCHSFTILHHSTSSFLKLYMWSESLFVPSWISQGFWDVCVCADAMENEKLTDMILHDNCYTPQLLQHD